MDLRKILIAYKKSELPEIKMSGGDPTKIELLRDHLHENLKSKKFILWIYIGCLIALFLFFVITAVVKFNDKQLMQVILFGGEASLIFLVLRLINNKWKDIERSNLLLFLISNLKDENKLAEIIDKYIDSLKITS